MPRRKKNHENHSRSSLSINKEKPQQRYAANARERARMRVLSRAFCRLKTTLPWVPADTKLSKLDTLRLAASYIAHLKGILRDETLGSSETSLHPAMSLTWPFGFNRPLCGSAGGGSQEGGSLIGSDEDVDDSEDEDADDNDDGESISSCTWEEVSPSSAKDCVHLDTSTGGRRHGGKRTRGQGRQVQGKESTLYLNKQNVASSNLSPTSNNNNQDHLANRNTQNAIIRPLSQIQQHHHTHQQHISSHFTGDNNNALFSSHSQQSHLENKLSVAGVTDLENSSPPSLLALSQQTEILGMGNTIVGLNEAYVVRDMNSDNFTQHGIHQGLNPHHHDHSDEMHPISQGVFAFSNGDLISIG